MQKINHVCQKAEEKCRWVGNFHSSIYLEMHVKVISIYI